MREGDQVALVDPVARAAPAAARVLMAAIGVLGLLHLIFGEQLARMMPHWPAALPGRPYWAHTAGALMLTLACLALTQRHARTWGILLGALLVVPVCAQHVPRALPTGSFGDSWLNVLKWLALASGVLVAAARLPTGGLPAGGGLGPDEAHASGAWGIRVARALFAAFLMGSAVLHVRHAPFVAELMQPWMPARLFWTYLAAVALAAGAVGVMVPRTRRSAALFISVMIFFWLVLVHTPRMLADPTGPGGWSEMAEALAFSALAILMTPVERSPHGRAAGRVAPCASPSARTHGSSTHGTGGHRER